MRLFSFASYPVEWIHVAFAASIAACAPFPDRIRFEGADDPAHASTVRTLRAMGHKVQRSRQGDAHSIFVRDGTYYGAADHRIRGKASGY